MKRFTLFFILGFITFPLLQSCSWTDSGKKVEGNRKIVNHLINIADFTSINMDCFGEIIYRQVSEENPYFQITTDENILPYLDLRVEDDCLIISRNDTIIAPSKLTIYTNSRNLAQITLSDSASLHLVGEVNALRMDICLKEKAQLETDSLTCKEIWVDVVDYGNVKLSGASTQGFFLTGGNAKIDLEKFLVEDYHFQDS
jgi:hypothetical protein